MQKKKIKNKLYTTSRIYIQYLFTLRILAFYSTLENKQKKKIVETLQKCSFNKKNIIYIRNLKGAKK